MSSILHRIAMVALLVGSAILLFSCNSQPTETEESLDGVRTEESNDLTIIMSENGRKSYLFTTPLLEGYTLGRDPYREFRKGISITTYQDDSLTTVNAVLVANYAIYYEKRKLWEAKGDVVITKHDGTKVYTQQLFWNSVTKRIYSNVDTKLVTATDELIGEGFESDEEMNEPRFRRWKGRMQVDAEQLQAEAKSGDDGDEGEELFPGEPKQLNGTSTKEQSEKVQSGPQVKPQRQPQPQPQARPETKPQATPQARPQMRPNGPVAPKPAIHQPKPAQPQRPVRMGEPRQKNLSERVNTHKATDTKSE